MYFLIIYHYNHIDIVIPILQMSNQKHMEAKKIAQGQQLGRDGARASEKLPGTLFCTIGWRNKVNTW